MTLADSNSQNTFIIFLSVVMSALKSTCVCNAIGTMTDQLFHNTPRLYNIKIAYFYYIQLLIIMVCFKIVLYVFLGKCRGNLAFVN